MSLADLVYSVTTGPERRRRLLTPVALAIALGLLGSVVLGGRWTDRALGLPALLPGPLGTAIGLPPLVAGLCLHAWSIASFIEASGVLGVPLNPPRQLVVVGPYAWVRNPMLAAAYAWLSGLGFVLHSISIVCLWTPAFLALNVAELKLVEEPELERRFGQRYLEYKDSVPRFVPRKPA